MGFDPADVDREGIHQLADSYGCILQYYSSISPLVVVCKAVKIIKVAWPMDYGGPLMYQRYDLRTACMNCA